MLGDSNDLTSVFRQNTDQSLAQEYSMTTQTQRLAPISKSYNHQEIVRYLNLAWNEFNHAPFYVMSSSSSSSFPVVHSEEASASILSAANCPLQSDAHIEASNPGVVNCPAKLGTRPKSYSKSGMHNIDTSTNQN